MNFAQQNSQCACSLAALAARYVVQANSVPVGR
jgi:hypothetical protein